MPRYIVRIEAVVEATSLEKAIEKVSVFPGVRRLEIVVSGLMVEEVFREVGEE